MSFSQAIVRTSKVSICMTSAALFVAVLSGPVHAAVVQGSGGMISNRLCSAGVTTCIISTPNGPRFANGDVRRNPHQYFGNYGQGFASSTVSLNNGASASVEASFGADYLPTVKVGSDAGTETRTGASAAAFQSFTYGGGVAIDLALSGQLHYFTSGDVAGTFPATEFAGDGGLQVAFGLMTVSDLTSRFGPSSTGRDIILAGLPNCSSGALAAGGHSSAGVGAGEHTASIGLLTQCAGGAITLNPGDSFVVFASLQGISNRGGFIDATHTFSVQYDEQNTFISGTQDRVGAGFLNRSITQGAPVPEPGAWALLISGFGIAGSMLRRRRLAV